MGEIRGKIYILYDVIFMKCLEKAQLQSEKADQQLPKAEVDIRD